MNVRHAYACCALLALAWLSACTDAGKCERGTEGCACRSMDDEQGRCDDGASCEDGFCVDNGGVGDGDGDGDGDGPRDAGPPPDVDCDSETQEDVCSAFCEMFCYNQVRFCGRSECRPEDCEPGGAVYDVCAEDCTNLSCAMQLCDDQNDTALTCDDFGIEQVVDNERRYETMCIERDPLCVQKHEIGCSDVCGSDDGVNGDYVDNNICEDGHETSQSSLCNRGTDCTDCGPHPCIAAGEECTNHGDCCGFYGAGALCVDPDDRPGIPGPKPPVCNPICDRADPDSCPDGFRCQETSIDKSVCVPMP